MTHTSLSHLIFRLVAPLVWAGVMIPGYLTAQTKELPTEAVEIVKNFDARLEDAQNVGISPASLALDTTVQRQTYFVDARPSHLDYPAPRLRPLAFKRDQVLDHFNGFVKAGYGLPASPYVAGGYAFRQEDRFDAHLGFLYHAADNKKLENQRFTSTAFDLDGNVHLPDRLTVHGDIGFHQDIVSFYGYDHLDTTFNESATKQRFNRFALGGEVFNTSVNDLLLDYTIGANYYSLTDFFDAKESGLGLKLELTRWFSDSHPLTLDIGNELAVFSDTISKNLNTFYIKPAFTFHGDAFRVRVGINLISADGMKLLPNLEAMFNLAGNALSIYAGWQGDYYQNSFDHLRTYNPFIVSELDPRTTLYRDIYGGVKGAAQGWNYQAQVGFKKSNDLAMFLTDDRDTRRFSVLYDTVSMVYISATAGIELWPGFTFSGTVMQNMYDPKSEDAAWHLPEFESILTARYILLDNRLLLQGDGYLARGVNYLNDQQAKDRLGSLLDLSFSAHYQVIRNAGVWLQLNNLNNNKRERWHRYPTYGLNILGGVFLRF